MTAIRTIAIIIAAIALAVLVLKVLAFVTSILFQIALFVFVAVLVYLVLHRMSSSLRRRWLPERR
ncbi:MAG TPA: hypothetical protein VFB58_10420 [Chloroflexota bacterium]|nr:hypothetical protein [Chloroflexota bacterium]